MLSYLQDPSTTRPERGDKVRALRLSGRRVTLSRRNITREDLDRGSRGFTLIELVITIMVLTILTLGVVPLMKVSVKRQKEQQLRASLRQMRMAIDEFRRDTVAMQCTGVSGQPEGGNPRPNPYIDPRSKVMLSDCTIFGVDNPDRYPPDLQTLVDGVNVVQRAAGLGRRGDPNTPATEVGQLSTKKKIYLRGIPVDPMTGEPEWDLCSCYDEAKCDSWGGENVFDVRSKSKDTALNGEKYSDW
ncbi:MAG: type II secretion system protein [Acidobacteriota bacterium]